MKAGGNPYGGREQRVAFSWWSHSGRVKGGKSTTHREGNKTNQLGDSSTLSEGEAFSIQGR